MATTEKMSIHRALSERKMLDAKITERTRELVACAIVLPSSERINGRPLTKFRNEAKSDLDSILDMITRRNAISIAIAQSNAVTKVSLSSMPGVDITVAQAISLKNDAMTHYKRLIDVLENQFTRMVEAYDEKMANINLQCDHYIASVFDIGTNTNVTKETAEAMEIARKNWMERNSPIIVDPCNMKSVIDKYKNIYNAFTAEIDAVLSESNAITMIAFSYANHSDSGLDVSTNVE